MRTLATASMVLVVALAGATLSAAPAVATESCDDYVLIAARGTDAPQTDPKTDDLGAVNYQLWQQLTSVITAAGQSIRHESVEYPATLIDTGHLFKKRGTYLSSVRAGVDDLTDKIHDIRQACGAQTHVLLSGYSQGADVVGSTLAVLSTASLAVVSGVAVFGDPAFNGHDSKVNTGSYAPSHSGLLANVRPKWSTLTDAPVFSVCRQWDFYCQQQVDVKTWFGTTRVYDEPEVLNHNDGDPNKIHGQYAANDAKPTACKLLKKLGYNCGKPGVASSVDVSILLDTTPSGSAALLELQSRAAELIGEVSNNNANARYSVIGYDEGHVTDATDGFTSSPATAVDAIENLSVGTGTYGSIYSAITAANALPWRAGARHVTLTLSTSRACSTQFCNNEATTGLGFVYLSGDGARRAGVYTRDQEYWFESAGWYEAMDDRFLSRPGGAVAPSVYIDDLEANFLSALRDPDPTAVSGTSTTQVGGTGTFNASDVISYFADSPDAVYTWSVNYRGQGGGGGGGTPSVTAMSAAAKATHAPQVTSADSGAGDDSGDGSDGDGPGDSGPSLPEDQGPYFETDFTQPGNYDVTVTVYADGGSQDYSTRVVVDPAATAAPASPIVSSTIEDGVQTLTWTPGDGPAATAYEIVDGSGNLVAALTADADAEQAGTASYGVDVDVDAGDLDRIVAVNGAGSTQETALLTADSATYSNTTLTGGVPSGGELELSGTPSAELEHALAGATGTTSLAGAYQAKIVSPTGDQFPFDMTNSDATIAAANIWQAELPLRGATRSGSASLTGLMEDGLADELLAGGYVEFQLDGQTVRAKISAAANTAQLNQYVIDTNSPPPAGSTADNVDIDHSTGTMTVGIDTTASGFPVQSLTDDPANYDWGSATISDIRTWIGNKEIQNSLTGASVYADSSTVTLQTLGLIAGGHANLVQQFLEGGTLSFRVNGGDPNVFTFSLSKAAAEQAYPDQTPPTLVGRSTISATEFSPLHWSPAVQWGASDASDRQLLLDGSLPEGLSWDSSANAISGTPLVQGTYPITITAIGSTGQAEKTYSLVVGASAASAQTLIGSIGGYTDPDSGLTSAWLTATGYLRTDNPAFTATLPILTDYAQSGNNLYATIDDVTFLDPSGQPLPITGDLTISTWRNWDGTDTIDIESQNLTATSGTADVMTLLNAGGTLTFRYDSGALNTIGFAPST